MKKKIKSFMASHLDVIKTSLFYIIFTMIAITPLWFIWKKLEPYDR